MNEALRLPLPGCYGSLSRCVSYLASLSHILTPGHLGSHTRAILSAVPHLTLVRPFYRSWITRTMLRTVMRCDVLLARGAVHN
jgi:hypothetical protein